MSRYRMDIYNDHFGLTARPFSLVPDPDFLFWSPVHRKAFSMLEYGLMTHAPITLITGEPGAGKTTLLHHLLSALGEDIRVGMIANVRGNRGELLRWVLISLGLKAPRNLNYPDLFAQFQTFLISEYAAGRRVVLIFDEAQSLTYEEIEELRMFTNVNSNKDELVQLILVGQPELRTMAQRPELSQFAQRIAANFHIPAMSAEDVAHYIKHRLQTAGCTQEVFGKAAIELIAQSTGGVPRLVNQLCDISLVYAFTQGYERIPRMTVQQVLDDGLFFAQRMCRDMIVPIDQDTGIDTLEKAE